MSPADSAGGAGSGTVLLDATATGVDWATGVDCTIGADCAIGVDCAIDVDCAIGVVEVTATGAAVVEDPSLLVGD